MTTSSLMRACVGLCLAVLFTLGWASGSQAAMLHGSALVRALDRGGYVIVMRHASSPMARPTKRQAAPGNTGLERQLDAKGRASAVAMGRAFKRLGIPVGMVVSSPAFRARQTARLLGFPKPVAHRQLAESGKGMAAGVSRAKARWLRRQTAKRPRRGTDTLIVTHTPNLVAAFGKEAAGTHAGEALIFRPQRGRKSMLVARVRMGEWPRLTVR